MPPPGDRLAPRRLAQKAKRTPPQLLQCRCPVRSEQKSLHQICGLGSQPRLAPQGVGQVQAVHGDLNHACQQELRQEHRIAVPGANHTPFGLGPAQSVRLLPSGAEIVGKCDTAELFGRMVLGQSDPSRVGARSETGVGPVVLHCRDLGTDRRRRGQHARQPGNHHANMSQQVAHVPRCTPRRQTPLGRRNPGHLLREPPRLKPKRFNYPP